MRLVALAASIAAEIATWRRRRACPHQMVRMTDGPTCRACGDFWPWSDDDGVDE